MACTSFSALWLCACAICMPSFICSSWLMAAIFAFTWLAYSGSRAARWKSIPPPVCAAEGCAAAPVSRLSFSMKAR